MFDTASVFTAVPENIYLPDKGKPACLIRALTPDALAAWQKVWPARIWPGWKQRGFLRRRVSFPPTRRGGGSRAFGARRNTRPVCAGRLAEQTATGAYRLDDAAPTQ